MNHYREANSRSASQIPHP